jgi:hypothetical protein
VVVASPDRTFNLLDLQNGSTALLGEAVVPPGQYRAVRLVFDPTRSTLTETDGDLVATRSGPGAPGINWQAKADQPSLFALVEEGLGIGENGEDIVVDFDVGRSFLYDGGTEFTFIPHLRAIVRAGSGRLTAGYSGRDEGADRAGVVKACISPRTAQVRPLLATTRSAADGRFTASFLPRPLPGRGGGSGVCYGSTAVVESRRGARPAWGPAILSLSSWATRRSDASASLPRQGLERLHQPGDNPDAPLGADVAEPDRGFERTRLRILGGAHSTRRATTCGRGGSLDPSSRKSATIYLVRAPLSAWENASAGDCSSLSGAMSG